MKMDKLFAGLVALVAGLALSAGIASATSGYTRGDPTPMKLVPFYETEGSMFTAIAVQNMAGRVDSTTTQHAAVATAKAALMTAQTAVSPDLQTIANAEADLAIAEKAVVTEHLAVTVTVFNGMGMMMANTTLCLAENQFGYVLLTEAEVEAQELSNRGTVLSVDGDMIPNDGYATVAGGAKFSGCGRGAISVTATGGNSNLAVWAIRADSEGTPYGTDIPTATISMNRAVVDDSTMSGDQSMAARIACYSTPPATVLTDPAVAGELTQGAFMPSRCGLTPERHFNDRIADGTPDFAADGASTRAHVAARFDVYPDTENDVFVWLAAGEDAKDALPVNQRRLAVSVFCEDGTQAMIPDPAALAAPGAMVATAMISAPDKLTIIDPAGDILGPYTDQCMLDEGTNQGRGLLRFAMPDKSHAGMVWTDISHRGMNYHWNFPAYSMANPMTCNEIGVAANAADSDVVADVAAVAACM